MCWTIVPVVYIFKKKVGIYLNTIILKFSNQRQTNMVIDLTSFHSTYVVIQTLILWATQIPDIHKILILWHNKISLEI